MKLLTTYLILVMLFFIATTLAQKQYTVDGNTYTLITEVDGPLTLLWNTIDQEYRYFSKKDNTIVELKNTKIDGDFQEEYIRVLTQQTDGSISTTKVKFTRPDLVAFFNAYNSSVDPEYQSETQNTALSIRLGGFAGVSNNAYFINPDNTFLPVIGIDFEIIDKVKLKRHAVLFQFEQTLSSSDYVFSSSELSLSYRYKLIMQEKFDIFLGIKGASYTNISRDLVADGTDGEEEVVKSSGGDVRSPGSLGFGADIALGEGFLTFAYNDIVSLGLNKKDGFPIHLTVGYKFPL
ncbi:MAG: hypothetical protein ACI86C_001505 [Candidatus Latescibacterota bacterium]|jgi:hypothetical protein